MKNITPQQHAESYHKLFPKEYPNGITREVLDIHFHWLERLERQPAKALSTTNWCGKMTKALFLSLGVKTPKTKSQMYSTLGVPEV